MAWCNKCGFDHEPLTGGCWVKPPGSGWAATVTEDPSTWLVMKCPVCNGERHVLTMDHGLCRCGVCQATGKVHVDPRKLTMIGAPR